MAKSRKSRYGCRNCKLRKLKCDETRPCCVRCRRFGVLCNFDQSVPDLQPAAERVRTISDMPSPPPRSLGNAIWSDDGKTASFFALDATDQDLFRRFRCRTLFSLGDDHTIQVYEQHMLSLAFSCPFLLHGMLAIAAVHDRYLAGLHTRRRSLREAHHWAECTTQFNRWIRQPPRQGLPERHKDPLWATAGTLTILTCASINVDTDVWPLGVQQVGDEAHPTDWLCLGAGKMALWPLVDPSRPHSVFRTVFASFAEAHKAMPRRGLEGVPDALAALCGLEATCTAESSYFSVAHSFARLLETDIDQPDHTTVLMALSCMHQSRALCAGLRAKDPVALTLLNIWYVRARASKWWIDARAQYELPALRAYLEACRHDSTYTLDSFS